MNFFLSYLFLEAKRCSFRSKKLDDYSLLVENMSKKKRKRDGGVVVGRGKSLRLKYKKVIFKKIALEEEERRHQRRRRRNQGRGEYIIEYY